ncbi:MAG: hypothetical protein AseanaTS_26450 [Candidatus Pelagadaptatus aseana]|uniref:hypothetical protein n=1 Tax=Candidatus Pelagadaptatus aseana TaxID=3120508 RepID=UPI0039B29A2F
MKPVKTKQQQRDELNQMVEQFLSDGGDVTRCGMGESGRDVNQPLPKPPFVERSDQSRTLVNEVVQAIEERKQRRKTKPRKTNQPKEPSKELLVDDFGEPLRWVWQDQNKKRQP